MDDHDDMCTDFRKIVFQGQILMALFSRFYIHFIKTHWAHQKE